MRSEVVRTHLRCNQNCVYCTARRPDDDLAWARGDAVRARVGEVLSRGAREVVLTGGEPAMRRDLPALIADARRRGAERVVVETNATLVDDAVARAWRDAGVSLARVNLSAWGEALDDVTRDPGGFARTLAGLRSLRTAGVEVELCAALVAPTLAHVAQIPEALAHAFDGELSGLSMSARVPVESPDPSALARYEDAAAALSATLSAAKRVGLSLKLAPDSGPPPCVFPQPSAVASLYALTAGAPPRGDHSRLPACERCAVRDRCPGVHSAYLARFGAPSVKPVTDDRARRRLSLIGSTEAQVRREFVQRSRFADPRALTAVDEDLIRVNFHCNQACRFCFVSTHLPAATDDAVREAIVTAARAGRQVTLTGGEPTLNPRLVEYVALARAHSPRPVAMQTNAIRLADAAYTAALVNAGLGWAQVSLHASTAALSDAMTEAPGTFDKTVAGLDALHAHPSVDLVIAFVITRRNHADLAPFVRMVAARWPRAFVSLSFVGAFTDLVPRDAEMVPRYADVMPDLAEAAREATRLGVALVGFDSMCGVPLCLVPPEVRPAASEIPDGYDEGEFTRAEACTRCALATRCYGLRRSYRDLYGDGELRAVEAT